MKEHNLNPKYFVLDEIESIELIGDLQTIDITVEGTHMFYANDIYTHNSGLEEDFVQANSISDSYKKIMTSDFVLSLMRNLVDKMKGTARFHIIKNRFGPDGITLYSRMNCGNGNIQIYGEKSREGLELKAMMENTPNDVGQKDLLKAKWNSARQKQHGENVNY